MKTKQTKQGFTLIELVLVVAFMAILLLAILFLILQIGKMYTKGNTNKIVNQVSREMADIMRRDVQATNPTHVKTAITGATDAKAGRVCLGNVSYVWNTAALLNDGTNNDIMFNGKPVTFARVVDPSGAMCVASGGAYPMTVPATFQVKEMLSTDNRSLAVFALDFREIAKTSTRGLYYIKMTVGTNEDGTTQNTGTYYQCKPRTDESANFDYCSINDIDFMLRTGGGSQ